MIDKISQKLELAGRQIESNPFPCDGSASTVYPNRPEMVYSRLHLRIVRRSPQQRLNPGKQLLHVKRLGYVVIGSGSQSFHFVFGLASCGQHQNGRDETSPADLLAYDEAVAPRQHEDRKSTRLNSSHM